MPGGVSVFFSTVDLVNSSSMEKLAGKAGQLAQRLVRPIW